MALAGVLGLSAAAMLTLSWNQVRGGVIAGTRERAGPLAVAPSSAGGDELSGVGSAS